MYFTHIRQSAKSVRDAQKTGGQAIRVGGKEGENKNSLENISSDHPKQVVFREDVKRFRKKENDTVRMVVSMFLSY